MVQNDEMYDLVTKHINVHKAESRNFQNVFRTSIRPYWSNLTGFDIVKFEEVFLGTADDDISPEEAIEAKYGKEGVRVCKALLGITNMTDYFDAAKPIAMELWKGGYDLTDIQTIGEHLAFMAGDNFWSKVIRGEDVHISDITTEET